MNMPNTGIERAQMLGTFAALVVTLIIFAGFALWEAATHVAMANQIAVTVVTLFLCGIVVWMIPKVAPPDQYEKARLFLHESYGKIFAAAAVTAMVFIGFVGHQLTSNTGP